MGGDMYGFIMAGLAGFHHFHRIAILYLVVLSIFEYKNDRILKNGLQ